MSKNHFDKTEAAASASTWAGARQAAVSERAIMVAQFHAWLVKTRIETEKNLLNTERFQNDLAPFARAALDKAATPADVSLVVSEFAVEVLCVMDLKRKLALLNVYYRQAAFAENTESLTIEAGNEAEVNELWTWFIEESNE